MAVAFALSWLLAWIGGERIQSTPWVLLAYPMVRYAVYAAVAMALVTVLHPVVTIARAEQVERATKLHERAHETCFIANSCSVPIHHRPVVRS